MQISSEQQSTSRNNLALRDRASSSIKLLIDKRCSELVTQEDKKLINLIFSPNPTQQEVDELLKVFDIEAKSGIPSLMLAYLMKEHPELEFTNYETPRLKGLLDFHKFKNIKLLAGFSKALIKLNQAGIYPLVIKGGAMKVLRPGFARIMGDVDILVPAGKFEETLAICKASGFIVKVWARHAVDLVSVDKQSAIDVHRFIRMDSNNKGRFKLSAGLNEGLFKRARKVSAFGAEVLIPSNEDLLFLILTALCKNLINKTSVTGTLFTLIDCRYLVSQDDFNWQIVFENMKLTNTGLNVRVAAEFIKLIAPQLLPEQLCQDIELTFEEKAFCDRMMLDESFYAKLKEDYKVIKRGMRNTFTGDSTRSSLSQNITQDVKVILKYKYLKFIRNSPFCLHHYMNSIGYKECQKYI